MLLEQNLKNVKEIYLLHWVIKRINLVEVLHDGGISVFALT